MDLTQYSRLKRKLMSIKRALEIEKEEIRKKPLEKPNTIK